MADQLVVTAHGAVPDGATLNTDAIQATLDACPAGGTVVVPAGVFRCGGLRLRSGVRLHLERDAVLLGSTDWRDYGSGAWRDAFLTGVDLTDVTLDGEGTIDGADCPNPAGEEGFRGPHGLLLDRCERIRVSGLTFQHIGNWAVSLYTCRDAEFRHLRFRGGHDGIDAQESERLAIEDCDFRTGDDCLAGAGNRDCRVARCYFNTSCNGLRWSCVGFELRDCRFVGPGEYVHKVSGRRNMLTAMVHFSPTDRGYSGLEPHSDRWVVEDCEVAGVDCLYEYDYLDGLWQTGRPVGRVAFSRVRATGLAQPVRLVGDERHQLALTLTDCDLALAAEHAGQPVVVARQFGSLVLERCELTNDGSEPVLRAEDGSSLVVDGLEV